MPIVAEAATAIRADMTPFARDLKAGLGKAEKQFDTLGGKLKKALTPGNLLAAGGVAFGLAQVTSYIGDAINAASDLGETVSKSSQIFGKEAIPALEEWASTAAETMGQSKQQALDAASTFAIFGKSAGLAGDDLVGFSTDLSELASDLASFHNASPEEAILAIGAALRGESEPIRRFGVLLDDASLRAKAFEMGIISSTNNALKPQQRVLAAQALIVEQTADAQGDFERTSDGLANQQRILRARLEDVSAEIGEKLLPVVLDFVTYLNDEGIPVLKEFLGLLDTGNKNSADDIPILGEIEDFLNFLGDSSDMGNFADAFQGHVDDVARIAGLLGTTYEDARDRIQRIMERTGETQEEAMGRITRILDSGTQEIAQTIPNNIKHATADVDAAAAAMADGIPAAMEDAKNEAAEIAKQTPGAIGDSLRAGLADYQDDLDELVEMAANSVSDLRERQEIEGVLASEGLTDALNSDSLRTRMKAAELVDDLLGDYELLAPGALEAGELVNPNLRDGILSNISLAENAANRVRDAAGNPLVELGSLSYGWGATYSAQFMAGMSSYWQRIRNTATSLAEAAAVPLRMRSPAKLGPLSEPADKWGATLGQMFADGIRNSIPGVEGASLAMAGAAVPSLSVPGQARFRSCPCTTEGGNTYQWILNANGVERVFNSRDDFMQALDDLGAFGEGRL